LYRYTTSHVPLLGVAKRDVEKGPAISKKAQEILDKRRQPHEPEKISFVEEKAAAKPKAKSRAVIVPPAETPKEAAEKPKEKPEKKSRAVQLPPDEPKEPKEPQEPIPDQALTRRANNPFGFGFSIDIKKLLAKLPKPKDKPASAKKSRAVFLGPEKIQRKRSRSPPKNNKKSRAVALDDGSPPRGAPARKIKTRDWGVQAPETERRFRDSGIQAPDSGMLVTRDSAVQATAAPKSASSAAQAVCEQADASSVAKPDVREFAAQVGASASDADSEMMLVRQKLVTVEEDVTVWRMRAEAVDGRLAEALARLAAEARVRKEAEAELAREKEEKELLRHDLAAAQTALHASEHASDRMSEAQRVLTVTVEENTVLIRDLCQQLEAMRVDRDAHKTAAEEVRVQNGILRMRLGAADRRKTSTSTEAEELRQRVASLEATQLERSAEEVRTLASIEEGRDKAAAERDELQRLLDESTSLNEEREAELSEKIAAHVRQLAAARAKAEAAEAAKGARKVEEKEKTRTLIIKETELRETVVRETLRETHKVEVTRLVAAHKLEAERAGQAHMAALAAAQNSRDDVEAELEAEQERRRGDAEAAAEAAAAAERRCVELAEEITRVTTLITVEKETREVERAQYERTAESAAAALAALKQELAQLTAALEGERADRREERERSEEQYLKLQRSSKDERAALEEALREERAAREAENETASEEIKRLTALTSELRAEIRRLEELMAAERAEREAQDGAASSKAATHTTAVSTITEKKTRVERLLTETRERHRVEEETWAAQLAEAVKAHGEEKTSLEGKLAAAREAREKDRVGNERSVTESTRVANLEKVQLERLLDVERTARREEAEKALEAAALAVEKFDAERLKLERRIEEVSELERDANSRDKAKFETDLAEAQSAVKAAGIARAELEAALASEQTSRTVEKSTTVETYTETLTVLRADMSGLEKALAAEREGRKLDKEEWQVKAEAARAAYAETEAGRLAAAEACSKERDGRRADAAAASDAAASALRAHNGERATLEAAMAAEKDARRAEQVQRQWESAASLSAMNKEKSRLETQLAAEREGRTADNQAARETEDNQKATHRAEIRRLEAELAELEERLKGDMARSGDASAATLTAANGAKVKLEAMLAAEKEGRKVEREQAVGAAKEAEDAWELERLRFETRITTVRTDVVTVTERVKTVEEQKTFVEERLKEEVEGRREDNAKAAALADDAEENAAADLEAARDDLERVNRRVITLTGSEASLKQQLETATRRAEELIDVRKMLEASKREEDFLKNKITSLERQMASSDGDASARLSDLDVALSAARAQEVSLRHEMEQVQLDLQETKKRLVDARAAAAEAEAAAERVRSEQSTKTRAEVTRLETEVTTTRRALSGERDDATARLAEVTSRVASLEAEIADLRRQLADAEEAATRAPQAAPPAEDSDSDGEMISAAAFLGGQKTIASEEQIDDTPLAAAAAAPKAKKRGFGALLAGAIDRAGGDMDSSDEEGGVVDAPAASDKAVSAKLAVAEARAADLQAELEEMRTQLATARSTAVQSNAAASSSEEVTTRSRTFVTTTTVVDEDGVETTTTAATEEEGGAAGTASTKKKGFGATLGGAIDKAGADMGDDSDGEEISAAALASTALPVAASTAVAAAFNKPEGVADVGCQAEGDEAEDHRMALQVARGQMQVLMARLMGLGQDTNVSANDMVKMRARKAAKEDAAAEVDLAMSLSEDWEEDKGAGGEGGVTPRGALGFKDYKTVADNLRERCKDLITKGQAARMRIIALEGELAAAMNEKESAVQWWGLHEANPVGP
jgi:Mg2+ and Co2+ transporter CorA